MEMQTCGIPDSDPRVESVMRYMKIGPYNTSSTQQSNKHQSDTEQRGDDTNFGVGDTEGNENKVVEV